MPATPYRADDHILLLDIPADYELASLARILMRGSLVAIGAAPDVDRARRFMAEFDNVMFIEASPERIPWRDAYFTKVIVPPHLEPLLPHIANELHRVLRSDGSLVRLAESV